MTEAYEHPAASAAWGPPPAEAQRNGVDLRREPERSPVDGQGVEEPYGGGTGVRRDPESSLVRGGRGEVERAVPASQQLVDSLRRVWTIVRSSVPLRTLLFVLPPLVLPFALGLSVGAALAVVVLLLWLAGASAVLATMMFDGGDQLAVRAIERRLDQLASTPASTDNEALMAIGAQLDALSDRLDALVAARGQSAPPDMHHRPQRHWSAPSGGDHNEPYDHDVVPEHLWSRPEWQR